MDDALPSVPISQERLKYLLAAMLVYKQFLLKGTPPSEERTYTLLVLVPLIPKLQRGMEVHEGEIPLPVTVDEVQAMKSGLTMLLDRLNRKPVSRNVREEIARLKTIKAMLDQHFPSI